MVVRLVDTKSDADKSARLRAGNAANNDHEAKQWKSYVDTLKRTVESMHEICLAKQNVLGCEEALMYLTSAVRDFQSLISSINIELQWENSENRPHTVRWEIVGTHRRKSFSTKQLTENVSLQQKNYTDSCLQCRAKRRISSDLIDDENVKKHDVYERLYGKRSNVSRASHTEPLAERQETEEMRRQGCITGKLITPRSAMDIPQTKSSMAKIAASRQLLWQRHKKILTEKLSAKRRQEHSLATLGNRRQSLPILNKQTSNVKPTAKMNLESIRETHEDDRHEMSGDIDNLSTKTHAGHFKTRSDGCAFDLLDMTDDNEWQALTEEEESLAQEEESLKKEIEETESLSIDDELQRRVILDFSDVNIETGWQSVVDGWSVDNNTIGDDNDLNCEAAVENPKLTQQSCRFRQPGELVQIHQRLLSPLRKRNLDAEEIRKRQNKAEELRLMLQEQKAQRLRDLHLKVEDVRKKRAELLDKKRIHLERKMEKAAENRQRNLNEIVKKKKETDQSQLITNFIRTMESEQLRMDLQLKEQDREQRRLNLAEERLRQSRDKASKEAAMDERKRTAEQQKAEKLRKQTIKKQERQHLIEAQRNMAVETQRKKARLYEQRLETIKTNEQIELENLRNKIQEKSKRGAKRHEILVERIRQKAIESTRSCAFSTLADCAIPPSDLQYSVTTSNCSKKCIKCDYIALSDLNLIGHLLSAQHLSSRSLQLMDVNFTYLKSELENMVRIVEGNRMADNEELSLAAFVLNKTLRAKIKQKLGSTNLLLNFAAISTVLKQSFGRKSNEFRHRLQGHSRFDEQQRKKLEHQLTDLRRCFHEQKDACQVAVLANESGLIASLLNLMMKSSASSFECLAKIYYRLICKVAHFLIEIFSVNSKICCLVKFSDVVFNLLEWNSSQIELGQSMEDLEERTNSITAVYCILFILLSESSKLILSELNQFSDQFYERLQAIATYLLNSNFIPFYKHIVSNGIELVEFGFGQSVRPLNVLSSLIATLNADPETHNRVESQAFNLNIIGIQTLITEAYAKIRFDPVVSSDGNTVSSGTLMSSSLTSTNSSIWHANVNIDVECAALLRLWNSLCSKLTSDSSLKQKLLESLKDDESLQFVYILIFAVCNIDKSSKRSLTNNQLKSNSTTLPVILEATAHFASLSFRHQVICTIGWQKSLLVHICRLSCDSFQNSSLRFHLITALIVILLDNNEGLVLIRDYITPSWMVEFLKQLLNLNTQSENRQRFRNFLPEIKWRCALSFFSEKIDE